MLRGNEVCNKSRDDQTQGNAGFGVFPANGNTNVLNRDDLFSKSAGAVGVPNEKWTTAGFRFHEHVAFHGRNEPHSIPRKLFVFFLIQNVRVELHARCIRLSLSRAGPGGLWRWKFGLEQVGELLQAGRRVAAATLARDRQGFAGVSATRARRRNPDLDPDPEPSEGEGEGKREEPGPQKDFGEFWCRRRDSNPHTLASTWT